MPDSLFFSPRSNPELKCLYEVSRVSYQNRLQDYFTQVMEKLSEYFPVEYSAVLLHDPKKDFLSVEAVYGMRREDHPQGCIRSIGIIGKAFESCEPMMVQNFSQEPLYHEIGKGTKKTEKIHPPMCCIPMIAEGVSFSTLMMNPIYGRKEEFNEDLQFLSLLSRVLSPYIKDFQVKRNRALAKHEGSKLKLLALEDSLEVRLNEVLDKVAPYVESKTHLGIFDDIIAVVEKILIKSALEKVDHVQIAAAQLLGINRNTLRKKMKDLKIKSR